MTNVLEHSVNTGAVFAQSRLGDEPFVEYLEKFGIFEPTGIDLPETFSANAEFKRVTRSITRRRRSGRGFG